MMKQFLAKSQKKRTVHFQRFGQYLLKLGITANQMTLISLLSGITAVYFLFSSKLLFIILAITHLIADGLDGVLARLSTPSRFGHYFDYGTDRLVTFLALIKLGWFVSSYAYLVAFLFILTNIFYVTTDFRSPVLFTRTLLIILLILQLPQIAYLVVGLITAYSLVTQLMWLVRKKKTV